MPGKRICNRICMYFWIFGLIFQFVIQIPHPKMYIFGWETDGPEGWAIFWALKDGRYFGGGAGKRQDADTQKYNCANSVIPCIYGRNSRTKIQLVVLSGIYAHMFYVHGIHKYMGPSVHNSSPQIL